MRTFMNIAKALAEENRVRIILALRRGELCVCEIIALLGLAPSTVSKHVSILRQAGLVEVRKEGRWMYYRLAGEEASDVVRGAIFWAFNSIGNSKTAERDSKRLSEILSAGREVLCGLQRKGKQ